MQAVASLGLWWGTGLARDTGRLVLDFRVPTAYQLFLGHPRLFRFWNKD